MHYCLWNIADYVSHTGHLSPIEDIAYRRMLDLYYLHEKPLSRDPKAVARDIRMREHEAEVRAVLAEFFDRTPGGYTNKRADEEIARYRTKVEQASNAGRTSAQRRANGRSTTVERPFNEPATDVQPTKNQEPRTNPQTPNAPLNAERSTIAGVDASRAEAEPEPASRDPVVELQQALLVTTVLGKLKPLQRGIALMDLAKLAAPSGLTAAFVRELWPLAQDQAQSRPDGDAGALLRHWIEHGIWREVLDQRGRQAKELAAASRTHAAASADPLAGVYGA